MALSAGYIEGDGTSHDTDLSARGANHSAFALIANDTIALIKQATMKHVSWTIDPADDTRYRFEKGFDFLLMLCPCEVLKDAGPLALGLSAGTTKLHVLVSHVEVCFEAGMPSTATDNLDAWWKRLIEWARKLKKDSRMWTKDSELYKHQENDIGHTVGFVEHGTNADCIDGDGIPVAKPHFYYYVGAHYLYEQRKPGSQFYEAAALVRAIASSAVPTVAMMLNNPNDLSAMSGILQWLADSRRPEILCTASVNDSPGARIMDLNHRVQWAGGKASDRSTVLQKAFGRLLQADGYDSLQKTLSNSESAEAYEQYIRLVRERKSQLDPLALSTLKVMEDLLSNEVHIFDQDANKHLTSAHDRVSLLVQNTEAVAKAVDAASKGSVTGSISTSGSYGGYTKDEVAEIMLHCKSNELNEHADRVKARLHGKVKNAAGDMMPDPLAELKAIREILAVPRLQKDGAGNIITPKTHVLLGQVLLHNRKLTKAHHPIFEIITDLHEFLELYISQFTIWGYDLGESRPPNAKLRQLIIPNLLSAVRDEGWQRVDWLNEVALVVKSTKNYSEYDLVLVDFPMAELKYLTEVEPYLCNSLESVGISPTGVDSPASLLAQCRGLVSDTDHLKGDLHEDMQCNIADIFIEGLRCGFKHWKRAMHNRRPDVRLDRVLLPGAALLFRSLIVDVQSATERHRNLISVMPSLRKFFDAEGSQSTSSSLKSRGLSHPYHVTCARFFVCL